MSDEKNAAGKDILYAKVKTTPIRVKIQLVDGTRVEGLLHQPTNLRLADMMNRHTCDNPFLAVTDANIFFVNGEHLQYRFFTLNRDMIVCCFPLAEEVELFP
ncbi:MAG: hypothetical protein PHI06_11285 [Desulfobulbaceae bacterium]|nr:hypothetical protein [Desulfobulbaceae bacterium]